MTRDSATRWAIGVRILALLSIFLLAAAVAEGCALLRMRTEIRQLREQIRETAPPLPDPPPGLLPDNPD